MGTPIDVVTFLARARERFGDRYDYSEIVYKSYKTPIRLRCTLHPVRPISITPERHLQTTGGCKYCLRVYRNSQLERTLRMEMEEPIHPDALSDQLRAAMSPAVPAVPLQRLPETQSGRAAGA